MTRRPSSPLSGRLARGNAGSGVALEVPETIAGLLAWWDPAASYITKDGSDRVSAWVSREGNAYSLTQASGPAQFLWSGTGVLSKPALYGDGARYIYGAAALAALIDGSAAYTAYYVVDQDNTASGMSHVGVGDSASSVHIAYHLGNGTSYTAYRDDGAGTTNNYTSAMTSSPEYYSAKYSGTAYVLGVSGVHSGSLANTRAPTANVFFAGARRYSGAWGLYISGWIADILIYDHSLTSGEEAQLDAWVQAKYVGI